MKKYCVWHEPYQIVRDEGVKPSSKFVFLLNDVVADGAAAGVFGLGPAEGDGLVVEVHDAWLSGCAGRLWNTIKWLNEMKIF